MYVHNNAEVVKILLNILLFCLGYKSTLQRHLSNIYHIQVSGHIYSIFNLNIVGGGIPIETDMIETLISLLVTTGNPL